MFETKSWRRRLKKSIGTAFAGAFLSFLIIFTNIFGLYPTAMTVHAVSLPGWATMAGLSSDDATWDSSTKTLTLLRDIYTRRTMDVQDSAILDLNGYQMKAAPGFSGEYFIYAYKDLTITGNGTIDCNNICCALRVSGPYTVTLDSGIITNTHGGQGGAVHINNKGTFIMNGGSLQNCVAGFAGGGVYCDIDSTFVMNGGTFGTCRADNGSDVYDHGGSKIIITGGSFTDGFLDIYGRSTTILNADTTGSFGIRDSGNVILTPACVVSFNANGGSGTMGDQVIALYASTALNANSFTREGYTFSGWTDAESNSYADGATVNLSAGKTLTAQWTENTYSITVTSEGSGSASADAETASAGTTVNLTATPASGHQFKEWQVVSGGISVSNNSFTMPSGNVSVKAVFEEIPNQNQGNDDGNDDDNNNQTNPDDQNNNNNNNDNNDENNNTDNNDDVNDDNNQNNNNDVNDDNNKQNNNTDVNDDNNDNNNSDDDNNNNSDVPSAVAHCLMYRLYNPNSGEHFYTGSTEELEHLKSIGWVHEGNGFEVPVLSDTPVYRLYNPNAGDHHYTTSEAEKNMLENAGWNYEGIAWYSAPDTCNPLYRLNNPNATSGAHHFTMSEEERDNLIHAGWTLEGIGWYGY